MPGSQPDHESVPVWVEPMLAQSLDLATSKGLLRGDDWVYERKLDGLRCLATKTGGQVDLWSRNRLPFTGRFQSIAAALQSLPLEDTILDGEVVAFDSEGRTSFSLLQSRGAESPTYFAFDVPRLLGRDTTGLALTDRVALLRKALSGAPDCIRVVSQASGDASELLSEACAHGWEGLVAKKSSSTYRSGRTSDWRKLKCSARQELVVGGWTEPSGSRSGFGALLVGFFDDQGHFRYAGRVGTGFDSRELVSLHRALLGLEVEVSRFLDAPAERGVHWSEPVLVAEVSFTEWTPDGRLRHPSFLGLREDKDPRQVRREDTRYPGPP